MNEPEFVRGNQKSYVRVICEENITESYEYKMCLYNEPGSLLRFQQRFCNGEYFLYYEVSGMQSLDIIIQSRILKRSMAIIIIKSIIKLCHEFSEYALDVNKVLWNPKYIMIMNNGEGIQYVYSFPFMDVSIVENWNLERLVEFLIEYLDYQDELLVTQIYQVYDLLTEQKGHFRISQEMEKVLHQLSDGNQEEKNEQEQKVPSVLDIHSLEGVVITEKPQELEVSEERQKERQHWKVGMMALLAVDISLPLWWTPLTLLKIFLMVAFGIVLIGMIWHICKQDQKKQEKFSELSTAMEKYQALSDALETEQRETCLMRMENNGGVLINLQKGEPQNISISDVQRIIGKDRNKAQVIIDCEGISRMHALIYRLEEKYFIEDLNSTNGTIVNGKWLEPREPYMLREGDKIRFAGVEYVFRI